MLKNLNDRKLNQNDWPHFEQRSNYIVANATKVFDILSYMTKNKEQRSLDEFRVKKGQKISPEYEEKPFSNYRPGTAKVNKLNQIPFCTETKDFDLMEMKHHMTSKLDEVNQDNIDSWIELMKKAVKDLTVLMKKERNSNLSLEDLYQAFNTIRRVRDKMHPEKAANEKPVEEFKLEDLDFRRPTLGEIKDRTEKETKEEYDISDDFSVCITNDDDNTNFGLWCFNPGF